jgi:hypothetical protein
MRKVGDRVKVTHDKFHLPASDQVHTGKMGTIMKLLSTNSTDWFEKRRLEDGIRPNSDNQLWMVKLDDGNKTSFFENNLIQI